MPGNSAKTFSNSARPIHSAAFERAWLQRCHFSGNRFIFSPNSCGCCRARDSYERVQSPIGVSIQRNPIRAVSVCGRGHLTGVVHASAEAVHTMRSRCMGTVEHFENCDIMGQVANVQLRHGVLESKAILGHVMAPVSSALLFGIAFQTPINRCSNATGLTAWQKDSSSDIFKVFKQVRLATVVLYTIW